MSLEIIKILLSIISLFVVVLIIKLYFFFENEEKDYAEVKEIRFPNPNSTSSFNNFNSNQIILEKNNSLTDRIDKKQAYIELIIKPLTLYQSTKSLISTLSISNIRYFDLLQSIEWQIKRCNILFRDNFKCIDCDNKNSKNHIHHLRYIKDKLPWQIEDEYLVTLCKSCHTKRHKKEKILIYEESGGKLSPSSIMLVTCSRCGGTGHIPQFNHIQNGVCFKCNGEILEKKIFFNALENFSNCSENIDQQVILNNYAHSLRKFDENSLKYFADCLGIAAIQLIEPLDDLPF